MIVIQRFADAPDVRTDNGQHLVTGVLSGLCDLRAESDRIARACPDLAPVLRRLLAAISVDADAQCTALCEYLNGHPPNTDHAQFATQLRPTSRTPFTTPVSTEQACRHLGEALHALCAEMDLAADSPNAPPFLRQTLLPGTARMRQHRHRLVPWGLT